MTDSTIRQSMISAREEYIGIIRDELLGPGSEFSLPDKEHELISSTPTSRYSVGILFPQGKQSIRIMTRLLNWKKLIIR